MERTTVWWHNSPAWQSTALGLCFTFSSTARYWSQCFVFIPVFSSVMNFICLVLHISDMFQFNVTYSLSYITRCQDLRLQKILFLHLADVGLISFTDIWITGVITESDSFIKLSYVSCFNTRPSESPPPGIILYLRGLKPLWKAATCKV